MPKFVQSKKVSNSAQHPQALGHRLDSPLRRLHFAPFARASEIRFDGCDLSHAVRGTPALLR